MMSKKLTRNISDKMIAGVASGLADYFQLDVTWVRIAFVLAAFFGGGGLWIYLILWIAVPENNKPPYMFDTDYKVYDDANPASDMYADKGYTSTFKPEKEKINASLIGGLVLIALGSYFLLDEFDIIPDWFRIGKLWPLIFVVLGLSILFKGARQETKSKEFDTSDFKREKTEEEDTTNQTDKTL